MTLSANDFGSFFRALYPDFDPMEWQIRAAQSACDGDWYDYISLPTGAGKTSIMDIALFALAVQADLPAEERSAPMRTFLVVDRRTVVNEAFHRAEHLRKQLLGATSGILQTVAQQLSRYGGSEPLSVVELRGGIYRDPSWCDSLTQPMIVTSTVDQVGSRLLFRGYGVSNSSRPLHAAVIAHDSLLILDEAHISKPFSQTLRYLRKYQQPPWSADVVPMPMRVVEMTATPPDDNNCTKLEISSQELQDSSTHIGRIVNTPKITTLEIGEKVKGSKAPDQLAKLLSDAAFSYVSWNDGVEDVDDANDDPSEPLRVVGVMANTVATAKATYHLLCNNKKIDPAQVHLIIGATRPLDRDQQSDVLRNQIATGQDRASIVAPLFVVATQCIEVGADYDFDVLVTEAAPISALVQRFGRLNRAGRENIQAVGHVIMRGDRTKTADQLKADDAAFRDADPIYGNALSYSWNWLIQQAKDAKIDFGIAAFRKVWDRIADDDRSKMSINDADAPVMLPSHLDLLCQTTIAPHPDPDVSLWLHGPQRNDAEVQVCWRADLFDARPIDGDLGQISIPDWTAESKIAIQAVSLCPPSAAECMSVKLVRVKQWLTSLADGKKLAADTTGDVPAIVDEQNVKSDTIPAAFRPVAWRGVGDSKVIDNANQIRPGDTLVFSVFAEGWHDLGFIPDGHAPLRDDKGRLLRNQLLEPGRRDHVLCKRTDFDRAVQMDRGTEAFEKSRQKTVIRIHPAIARTATLKHLATLVNEGARWAKHELLDLIELEQLPDVAKELASQKGRLQFGFYDDSSDASIVTRGMVIVGKQNLKKPVVLPDDDGMDLYSCIEREKPVPLHEHCQRVLGEVDRTLQQLSLPAVESLRCAALRHDWGKADPRFQAMLLGGDIYTAYSQSELLAKSNGMPRSFSDQRRCRERAELPRNFRHEFASVVLAQSAGLPANVEDADLLLHLIASHHGFARPWPPVCHDLSPPDLEIETPEGRTVSLSTQERQDVDYYAVDSPVITRFVELNRKYGWWSVAYIESVLRFADRRASCIESHLQSTTRKQQEAAV